jgi:23S rRNA G2445 N2-methylase RlmL
VQNFERIPTKLLIENLVFDEIAAFRFYYNIIELQGFTYFSDTDIETIRNFFEKTEIRGFDNAEYFRVTSKRYGNHAFTSVDLQKHLGQILITRFGKKVSLENYDLNFRADIVGNLCFWGLQRTNDAPEFRFLRPFVHRAAIKQTLAHALIRIAELHEGMRVLDCTCGSGTILAEAASCVENLDLYGTDLHDEYIAGAKENLAANGISANLQTADARDLSRIFEIKFDRVIANLPFGMVSGKNMDLKGFYFRLTAEIEKILTSNGRAVLFTARPGAMKEVLLVNKLLFVAEEYVFDAGSVSPHVLVLEKVIR